MKKSVLASPAVFVGWLFFVCLFWSCNTENPVPAAPPSKLSKIVWDNTDYQAYEYNAAGELAQYVSQFTYGDEEGEPRKLTATFDYDANHHLTKVLFNGAFYTKYYYNGDQLTKSEEYDSKNRLALTHNFYYNPKQQLTEIATQVHDQVEGISNRIKRTFTYDSRGNVIVENMSVRLPDKEVYYLSSVTRYEDYDQQKSAENLTEFSPYLPHIKLNVNNPGKRTVIGNDGVKVLSVETYTYQYNEQGYPSRKTVHVQTSPDTPAANATYEYR